MVQQTLSQTIAEFDTWFEQSEESRSYKPADGGWTINEILEHTTLTSHYLLIIIRKGCEKALKRAAQGEQISEGESDLNRLSPIGHPDAFPWIRPEHMEPTGSLPPAEIQARAHAQYHECLAILTSLNRGEGSLYSVRMSVQNLGKMDMYQWLYFLALHQKRHITQIERIHQAWQQRSK